MSNITLKSPVNWSSDTSSLFITIPLQPVSLRTSTGFSPTLPLTTGILLLTAVNSSTQALLNYGILLPQANSSLSSLIQELTSSSVGLTSGGWTRQLALNWARCTELPLGTFSTGSFQDGDGARKWSFEVLHLAQRRLGSTPTSKGLFSWCVENVSRYESFVRLYSFFFGPFGFCNFKRISSCNLLKQLLA